MQATGLALPGADLDIVVLGSHSELESPATGFSLDARVAISGLLEVHNWLEVLFEMTAGVEHLFQSASQHGLCRGCAACVKQRHEENLLRLCCFSLIARVAISGLLEVSSAVGLTLSVSCLL